MFGFGKKKKKNLPTEENTETTKRKTRADKIVMGAILGVAIGSVVSASLMPKKKSDKKKDESARTKKDKFSLFGKAKKSKEAAIKENPKKIPTEAE